MFAEAPLSWELRDFGSGNAGLFALAEHTMHVIVSPGNRLSLGDEDAHVACWRHAIWSIEVDAEPIVLLDPPQAITSMRAEEVLSLLSTEHHDYVRSALAAQLRLASLHGLGDPDRAPEDRPAQLAGRARARVAAELAEAFPGESWYRENELSLEIPSTIEELLLRIPTTEMPADSDSFDHLGQAKFQPHRHYLMHIVKRAERKPPIASYCYYALEKVRYSFALKILRTHERAQLAEVTECRQWIEEPSVKILSGKSG
jgi:hypothetical protein